jgi:pSer/pThr/pTyr-binding forkhead associated (FHA) protein
LIRLTALIELEGQAPRALTHESNAKTITLGRDATADFQIPLSTISRQHVRISSTDNVYVIEDLGSTHGTMVNGRKLDKNEKKVLRNGDVIELTRAKITAAIEEDKVASADPGEGTQAIAARAVQGILGRLGEARSEGPFFRVIAGPDEGSRYKLAGTISEWSLGRSKDCEFVLNDPNVSRRHAVVKKDWNGFIIHDLGSKNGVVVNDKLIQKPRRLRDRDEIIIGPVKLVFVDPDAELMAALKDVPGFELDPNENSDADEPSHMGAPAQAEAGLSAEDPAIDAMPPLEEPEPEIDPELLAPLPQKSPFEWLIMSGVLVLVLSSVAVLLFIFLPWR